MEAPRERPIGRQARVAAMGETSVPLAVPVVVVDVTVARPLVHCASLTLLLVLLQLPRLDG